MFCHECRQREALIVPSKRRRHPRCVVKITCKLRIVLHLGFVSYVWTPNVVSNEGGDYVPSSVLETDYAVTGTDSNGCQNSDNVSITINNIPNPGPIIFN